VRAIAAATGVDFALDVILDGEQQLVQAFGGELPLMHAAACATAKRVAMRELPTRYDVVVTTNSGFPLDQNLYQAVKGMSAAAQVVKDGGTIICAAECRDGFPDHGSYRAELTSQPSPQALLESILGRERAVPDQWQIQIQATIQARARVVMHTSYLSDDDLAAAHLTQTSDVAAAVEEALGSSGSLVCVLPEGPQTIPYVSAD
jgi:nickel-dependent lactate racemase